MTAGRRAVRRRSRRRRADGARGAAGGVRLRRWLLLAAGILALAATSGAAVAGGSALYGKQKYDEFVSGVAPPEELLATLPRGGARIYDRHGQLLYEFVDEFGGLRRPVPLEDISEWVVLATVATEDASFWENNGLNIRGLIRAGIENLTPLGDSDFFEGSGGSSITQQLAKNVYIPLEERTERTIERKLREAAIALELTGRYTKEQILEWYLNSISYGGVYVGIEAAAEGYFGKQASDLTLAEASLLAGIPASPARYDPIANLAVARARQQEVLNLMVRNGAVTEPQAARARAEEIVFKANRFEIEAPHFVLGRVAREIQLRFGERALYEHGLEVVTTLDLGLQREAQRILEARIAEFEESSDGRNGALLALDPATGQIIVYAGSRDYFRDDIEGRNDNVTSLNSPGSTLKPFTYMTAFMQGWGTGHGILDTPARVIDPATGGFYAPRNPSGDFQGAISAADALGNSLNIPAFKAILFAGVDNTMALYRQVGITTLDNPLGYGPSLTLGGVDVTLEDVTYAYSVLANGGVMRGQAALEGYDPGERTLDPIALLRVTDADGEVLHQAGTPEERRVVGANFAYLVTAVLSDPDTQCITFGCGGLRLPGRPSAQKTGTSEPYENSRAIGDTWALGYTPQLVAGVWAGNADNSPMVNIDSTRISWRSWREFMTLAHERLRLPPARFEEPPGVERAELCWPSGLLPTRDCPDLGRYEGLYATDVLAGGDEEDRERLRDTWWREVDIDTRTGLLATPETPAGFVSREVRLVLPDAEIGDWSGLGEWAEEAGLTTLLAPTESAEDARALLYVQSPAAAQTVSGAVFVRGRADSPDFRSYAVEWGRGDAPDSWVSLRESEQPVAGGELAAWDTTQLPDGPYALRVRLEDARRGTLRYLVPVTVSNSALYSQIASPRPNETVSGAVVVRGRADSPEFRSYAVEWGRGDAPASWVSLRYSGQPVARGELAVWDTTQLPDGLYALRVRLEDARRGTLRHSVTVTVANGERAAEYDASLYSQIESPEPNETVSGVVALKGLAYSAALREVVIEVGAGLHPLAWTTIRRDARESVVGDLGDWDTTALTDGVYTLRITVRDAIQGDAVATVAPVIVRNADAAGGE